MPTALRGHVGHSAHRVVVATNLGQVIKNRTSLLPFGRGMCLTCPPKMRWAWHQAPRLDPKKSKLVFESSKSKS
jgi:hypothetical protein